MPRECMEGSPRQPTVVSVPVMVGTALHTAVFSAPSSPGCECELVV